MAAQLASFKPVDGLVEMAEILEDLHVPNKLARAEVEATRLRRLREDKTQERRRLIHENLKVGPGGTGLAREIDAATTAVRAIDKLLTAALGELQLARKLFEPQVQAALEPYRVAAAKDALRALDELEAAGRILNGARTLAARRGASLTYDITLPNFAALRRALSLLVDDGSGSWQ